MKIFIGEKVVRLNSSLDETSFLLLISKMQDVLNYMYFLRCLSWFLKVYSPCGPIIVSSKLNQQFLTYGLIRELAFWHPHLSKKYKVLFLCAFFLKIDSILVKNVPLFIIIFQRAISHVVKKTRWCCRCWI